ncbi:MAG: ABC transporter substrate-binding protein [Candidatus Magnetoglobus multicellularis str. Araruama]|uniref:ABC transporter substrate-binding protein n=1 Tax=Candidatus Magnetoglobus multicellularis str. Araruama TaxID=890399 RepID=A0A1V1PDC4_9BACT|nr:MAG: ABC transporter substrate-binding protein [Candidatus Magnetoglobus multicellularis str. Araruama]
MFTHSIRILAICVLGLTLLCSLSQADSQCPQDTRSLEMGIEYPGITIEREDTVSMDIVIYNRGCSNESVHLQVVRQPKDWTTKIKTYQFEVSDVYVPAAQEKNLTFEALPKDSVKPGKYAFEINARTQDGRFQLRQPVHVTVIEKTSSKETDTGVRLSTSYPELRGPTDGEFEFSVEVNSRLDRDAIFNLSAQGPDGWDINFKPAYESKYISSLRIKEGQNATVAVQVKPPMTAQIGEYPVSILVQSGDAKAEADLKVILTGTYEFETGTASGLLSLDARAGKKSSVSVYVKNTGSATQQNIKFMSFKPENWKVSFEPEALEILEPNDMKQVEVTIEPYDDALVGDYSVSVNIQGEKVDKTVEFRITVKASAAWAWIGILIIVAVISGLSYIFQRMGRR